MNYLILRTAVLYYERLGTTRILHQRLESQACERLRALCRTELGDPVRRAVRGVTAAVTRPFGPPYAASSDPEPGDNGLAYGLQRPEVTRGENWQRKVTHYESDIAETRPRLPRTASRPSIHTPGGQLAPYDLIRIGLVAIYYPVRSQLQSPTPKRNCKKLSPI
jgi:hypothetical protein